MVLLIRLMEQVLDFANKHELRWTSLDALGLLGKLNDGLAQTVNVPDGLQDCIHETIQLVRLGFIDQLE